MIVKQRETQGASRRKYLTPGICSHPAFSFPASDKCFSFISLILMVIRSQSGGGGGGEGGEGREGVHVVRKTVVRVTGAMMSSSGREYFLYGNEAP